MNNESLFLKSRAQSQEFLTAKALLTLAEQAHREGRQQDAERFVNITHFLLSNSSARMMLNAIEDF